METAYLTYDYVIKTHEFILERSGGLNGIFNEGRIESILEHIKNDDYYGAFSEKLTHLIYSLVNSHCFCDGNKRTAIGCGASFLIINGFDEVFVAFVIAHLEDMVVWIAEKKLDKEKLNLLIDLFIYQYGNKLNIPNPTFRKANLEKEIDSALNTLRQTSKKIKDKYPHVVSKWTEEDKDKDEYDSEKFNIQLLEKIKKILNGEYPNNF